MDEQTVSFEQLLLLWFKLIDSLAVWVTAAAPLLRLIVLVQRTNLFGIQFELILNLFKFRFWKKRENIFYLEYMQYFDFLI